MRISVGMDPPGPSRGVRELCRDNWNGWAITNRRQCRKCAFDIIGNELHDDIDILSEAQIAMRIHGQPSSHDVAYPGVFQRGDNHREAREFHTPAIMATWPAVYV
jgi:hypothetical protein